MLSPQTDQRVSSADFIRRFANWRAHSVRKPVVVTHHGKDAHVLLSHDDYQQLFDSRSAKTKAAMDQSLAKLVDNLRDGILVIDGDQRIMTINRAACDMASITAESAIGARFDAVFPHVTQGHLHGHIARMLTCHEGYAGDSNLPGGAGRCFHLQLVPVRVGGVIILRDNSDEMAAYQHGQTRRAILRGIAACGGVGYARLSSRGVVTSADERMVEALGVSEDAMRRVRFSALLPVAMRAAFGDALEAALDGGEPVTLASALVGNDGHAMKVRLSIVELRGPFACEGAMVVVAFPDTLDPEIGT